MHHDNACAHRFVTTNSFLTKQNIAFLPQYATVEDPCDFSLLPQLKGEQKKGHRFDEIERFKPTQRDNLGLVQNASDKGASFNGMNAGISVYNLNGTTLKEMELTSLEDYIFCTATAIKCVLIFVNSLRVYAKCEAKKCT